MATINFPSAPAINDEYTFEGKRWRYNGSGWILLTGTAGDTGGVDVLVDGVVIQAGAPGIELAGSDFATSVNSDGSVNVTIKEHGYLHVQDQKASGTDGGTFTSGAWQTRVLNSTVLNTITGASLASNQITLPAGTYEIHASAPGHQVETHQTRLQNVTDATTALLGTTVRSRATSATDGTSDSVTRGCFTISGTKTFEFQHRCSSTLATTGFGTGNANTWGTVVFADVLIHRIS